MVLVIFTENMRWKSVSSTQLKWGKDTRNRSQLVISAAAEKEESLDKLDEVENVELEGLLE